MSITSIIQGHFNEAFNDENIETIALARLEICKKCSNCVKNKALGLRCSPNSWTAHQQPKSEELLNKLRQEKIKFKTNERNNMVLVKGCGCRLNAKTRVPQDECPAGKWLAIIK